MAESLRENTCETTFFIIIISYTCLRFMYMYALIINNFFNTYSFSVSTSIESLQYFIIYPRYQPYSWII